MAQYPERQQKSDWTKRSSGRQLGDNRPRRIPRLFLGKLGHTIYVLKSSTKSIGGSALGPALGDNLLQLMDFAQQYLPSLGLPPDSDAATGWVNDINIAELATHTAGFDRDGGCEELVFEPGGTWSYSDAGVNWHADILTVTFGQDLDHCCLLAFSRTSVSPAQT